MNGIKLKIIKFTFPQRGSLRIQLIFQSDKIINNLNKNDFLLKFQNDKDFPEFKNLESYS